MNKQRCIYVCPEFKTTLKLVADRVEGDEIASGCLVGENGTEYLIADGVPDLTFPRRLAGAHNEARDYYESVASNYDDVAHLTFGIQYVDESKARKEFADLLGLHPDHRVLELACGTGRDSEHIARRLGPGGAFYLQDLSQSMLARCKQRLAGSRVPIEFSVGNACYLPFPDRYFDAVFSFGGLSVFGDIGRSLREIARVSKVGAKVVVGDESMPPWLYDTEFGRILLANNPLFRSPVPLEHVPAEARDVVLRWVIGGVYYLIEFRVGEGEPKANFDLEIPGVRGGTLRTRFYGRLEGVTPEVVALARKAREKSGKSMHRWLDDAVRAAAEHELGASKGEQ